MKIKLKNSINSELTAVGLRPGMTIESNDVNKTTGAVQFRKRHNVSSYDCVVWPEDYDIVTEEKTVTIQVSRNSFVSKADIPDQISLPISEVTNLLDAMFWCFSQYLGNSDLSESPWIENLIKSYNEIVEYLPHPWNLRYHRVEY